MRFHVIRCDGMRYDVVFYSTYLSLTSHLVAYVADMECHGSISRHRHQQSG
jgi:hypothetical protein